MDVAVAAAGERRLAAVRAWWQVRHPPPSLGRRLDVAYTAAITVAILGAIALGAAPVLLAENGASALALAWTALAAGALAWLAGREPPES